MASNLQNITIHFPLPKGRHPGGRLQRKKRLRKKQLKYRVDNWFSFSRKAFIAGWGSEEIDGPMPATVNVTLMGDNKKD
jgi:hypothetical protein